MEDEPNIDIFPWPEQHRDVHTCPDPACRAEKVVPIEWLDTDGDEDVALLRCGECDTFYHGSFDQRQIDDFEDAFESHRLSIRLVLGRMITENMTDYLDRFVPALQDGRIMPVDF